MKALNKRTGQLEKVYVKALDSMPVGTVVEFNGQASDIPSGWEVISGKSYVAYELWTNPNPTSSFSGQDVEISLSGYAMIEIFYTRFQGIKILSNRIPFSSNEQTELNYSDYDSGSVRSWNRNVTLSTTKIAFGDCKINNTTTNTGLIPYKIIGYKEV